jgi:hypothetical protein
MDTVNIVYIAALLILFAAIFSMIWGLVSEVRFLKKYPKLEELILEDELFSSNSSLHHTMRRLRSSSKQAVYIYVLWIVLLSILTFGWIINPPTLA